jgi:hypothetical protein
MWIVALNNGPVVQRNSPYPIFSPELKMSAYGNFFKLLNEVRTRLCLLVIFQLRSFSEFECYFDQANLMPAFFKGCFVGV